MFKEITFESTNADSQMESRNDKLCKFDENHKTNNRKAEYTPQGIQGDGFAAKQPETKYRQNLESRKTK